MRSVVLALLLGLALTGLAPTAGAEGIPTTQAGHVAGADVLRAANRPRGGNGSFWQRIRDPEDGALDASSWLSDGGGPLPIPLLFSLPSTGFGGGVASTFINEAQVNADGSARMGPSGQPIPPDVTGLGAGIATDGSWGASIGHFGVLGEDRVRYTLAAGYRSLNLDYYGVAGLLRNMSRPFNIEGLEVEADVQVRLGSTPLFAGFRYYYTLNDVDFDHALIPLEVDESELNSSNARLGAGLYFDTRDNILTPGNGVRAQVLALYSDRWVGSDFTYWAMDAFLLAWKQVHPRLNVGLRVDWRYAEPSAPFYAIPYIDLRGVETFRYQGSEVLVVETELRWDFTDRWSAVGFGGVGWAAKDLGALYDVYEDGDDVQDAWGVGGGVRYLIARKLGLRLGVDVARGPDEWGVYVTVGSAWAGR